MVIGGTVGLVSLVGRTPDLQAGSRGFESGIRHTFSSLVYFTCVTEFRYMIHLYCLALQAGFYSDVVCRTLSPSDQVRSSLGKNVISIFSIVSFGARCK